MGNKPESQPVPQLGGMSGDAQKKVRLLPSYRDYQLQKMSDGGKPVPLKDFIGGKR